MLCPDTIWKRINFQFWIRTRILQYQNRSLLRNSNLQNSNLLPSVVKRWGNPAEGNLGGPHLTRGRSQRKQTRQPHKSRILTLRKDMVQWQIATWKTDQSTTVCSCLWESEGKIDMSGGHTQLIEDVRGLAQPWDTVWENPGKIPDTCASCQRNLEWRIFLRLDRNDPTASFPSFLAWVIFSFFWKFKNSIFWTWLDFSTFCVTSWFVSFLYLFLRAPARTLGTFWCLWCRHILVFVVSRLSAGNYVDKNNYTRTALKKWRISVLENHII